MEESALATNNDLAEQVVQELFDEVPNLSMVKEIIDLLSLSPPEDIITGEEAQRWVRIAGRLKQAAVSTANVWQARSELAVTVRQIREEEDWTVLSIAEIDDENGVKPGGRFSNWVEFRPVLARLLGISERTVNTYIKRVQFGEQMLKLDTDAFLNANGMLTVKPAMDMCAGIDGRVVKDFSKSARAKTTDVRTNLEAEYPGLEFKDQLCHYYHDHLAHDMSDPSAINKPPDQLAEQARQMTGEASVWFGRLYEKGQQIGFSCWVKYPDQPDYVGTTERFDFMFAEQFPNILVAEIASRLGIRD